MKLICPIGIGKDQSDVACVVIGDSDLLDTHILTSQLQAKLVICLQPISLEFVGKAQFLELAGLVVPGVHYRDWLRVKEKNDDDFLFLLIKKFGKMEMSLEEIKSLLKWNDKKVSVTKKENANFEIETSS